MIDSYSKLTIEKWYEINEVMNTDATAAEKEIAVVAILSDCSDDDVLDWDMSRYQMCLEQLKFITKTPVAKPRIPNKIKIGNMKFNVLKDVTDMKAGQYIDFETYIGEGLGVEYILSTVLIPEGKKYGEMDTVEIVNIIKKNLTVEDAVSLSAFFMKALRTSIKSTLIYLDLMLKRMERKAKSPEIKEKIEEVKKIREQMKALERSGLGLLS